MTRAYRGVPGPSKFKGGDIGCFSSLLLLVSCAFPPLIPIALIAVSAIEALGNNLYYGLMMLALLFLAVASPILVIISWFNPTIFQEGDDLVALCIYYATTIGEIVYGFWRLNKDRKTKAKTKRRKISY